MKHLMLINLMKPRCHILIMTPWLLQSGYSNQIKCASGAVFDASFEPLIPAVLSDFYGQRKVAKHTSQQADKEADELKKIKAKRLAQTL